MASPDTTLAALIDLGGRRAFVTGGANGIGAAHRAPTRRGRRTVTVGDVAADVADVAARFGAVGVPCDITDTSDVEAALEAAAATECWTSSSTTRASSRRPVRC